MTVILVLMTFAIFLLIDYVRGKKQVVKQAAVQPIVREVPSHVVPAMVSGFQVPENVRYHPGHTWALSESRELVRVGLDDFASKLVGKIENIALPQRGRWVRQGQKIWTIFRDGKSVDMVSPIEGTVSDINEAVVKDPRRHIGARLDGGFRPPLAQENAGRDGLRSGPRWRRVSGRHHGAPARRRLGHPDQRVLSFVTRFSNPGVEDSPRPTSYKNAARRRSRAATSV